MGCAISHEANRIAPVPAYSLGGVEARLKLACSDILAKSSSTAFANGPPTLKPIASSSGSGLPLQAVELHTSMPQHLKQANMRLLRISAMLSWRALPVYEDVQQGDYLQLPYASVPSSTWARCLTLSWRWGKPKPAAYVPDYSPATNEQWSELQDLLRHACANGLEYVWIDWCCMPQYQSDAIPEVMRSKVYYSRAAAMAVLPRFTQLSEAGPARLVDELEHVLTEALHLLKQQSKLAPPKMLSNGSVDGDSVPSADAPAAAAHVLDTILEKGTIASSDYLARAWTLAERMSRCGHRERLCEWLSLETWMGMVLDVLLKAAAAGNTPFHGVTLLSGILGPEISRQLTLVVKLLVRAVSVENLPEAESAALERQLADLCSALAEVWCSHLVSEEAPDAAWLGTYLGEEVPQGVYTAGDPIDLLWAMYSFFSWDEPNPSEGGMEEALEVLAKAAGRPLNILYGKPWPSTLYERLGMGKLAGELIQRERDQQVIFDASLKRDAALQSQAYTIRTRRATLGEVEGDAKQPRQIWSHFKYYRDDGCTYTDHRNTLANKLNVGLHDDPPSEVTPAHEGVVSERKGDAAVTSTTVQAWSSAE